MQLNFSKTPVTIGECFLPREEMLNHLTEFETLYSQRPINDNQGGMKAPQAFYAWLVAKKLNPSVIIESGVWFGQGTWLFEKACPDSKIICIEPNQNVIRYRSSRASYTQKDFNTIHWDKEITDPMNALCFFDDHQNALARLPVLKNYGFKHTMFEDNYPVGRGDCISLKSTLEKNMEEASIIQSFLDVYQEMPPPFKKQRTRWGDDWSQYPTHEPLLDSCESSSCYYEGSENYTWICYARIK
jgi:hypothetical protein